MLSNVKLPGSDGVVAGVEGFQPLSLDRPARRAGGTRVEPTEDLWAAKFSHNPGHAMEVA